MRQTLVLVIISSAITVGLLALVRNKQRIETRRELTQVARELTDCVNDNKLERELPPCGHIPGPIHADRLSHAIAHDEENIQACLDTIIATNHGYIQSRLISFLSQGNPDYGQRLLGIRKHLTRYAEYDMIFGLMKQNAPQLEAITEELLRSSDDKIAIRNSLYRGPKVKSRPNFPRAALQSRLVKELRAEKLDTSLLMLLVCLPVTEGYMTRDEMIQFLEANRMPKHSEFIDEQIKYVNTLKVRPPATNFR